MSIADHNVDAVTPRISEASAGDFIALLKPRVMSLVVFTALVGLVIAPGHQHPVLAFTSLLCIAIGAGAAGALNMWWDRDIDAVMMRTMNRPIPRGRVAPSEALSFGVILSGFSVVTLGLLVNPLAGALLRFHHLLLCRRLFDVAEALHGAEHRHRRCRGCAAAGRWPGRLRRASLSVEPWLLFALIFFWTPPHFWALSLYRCR